MSDEEIAKLKGPALHIPTVLGAVVITYNLPELTKPLNLTGAGASPTSSSARSPSGTRRKSPRSTPA